MSMDGGTQGSHGRAEQDKAVCDPLRSGCQGWRLKKTSDRRCQVLSGVSSP